MIELPEWAIPNAVSPALLDFGLTLRPSSGAGALRVDRPGSRFRAEVSLPPMNSDKARVVLARLMRGKSEGLRIDYPLLDSPQGSPGATVVDGAGQSGTTLNVRGFNPGYACREGYWLTVYDGSGQGYLHAATAAASAPATGLLALSIWPALRADFADGDTIDLAAPTIEGLVDGDTLPWELPTDRLIRLSFAIEEAA